MWLSSLQSIKWLQFYSVQLYRHPRVYNTKSWQEINKGPHAAAGCKEAGLDQEKSQEMSLSLSLHIIQEKTGGRKACGRPPQGFFTNPIVIFCFHFHAEIWRRRKDAAWPPLYRGQVRFFLAPTACNLVSRHHGLIIHITGSLTLVYLVRQARISTQSPPSPWSSASRNAELDPESRSPAPAARRIGEAGEKKVPPPKEQIRNKFCCLDGSPSIPAGRIWNWVR